MGTKIIILISILFERGGDFFFFFFSFFFFLLLSSHRGKGSKCEAKASARQEKIWDMQIATNSM